MPNSSEKADRLDVVQGIESIAMQIKAIGDLLGAATNQNALLNDETLYGIGIVLEQLGNKLEELTEEI